MEAHRNSLGLPTARIEASRRKKYRERRNGTAGRSPGEAFVVAEHDARATRQRRAGSVKARRAQVDQIPNAGHSNSEMRIVGEQRAPRNRPGRAGSPLIAAERSARAGDSVQRAARAALTSRSWADAVESGEHRRVVARIGERKECVEERQSAAPVRGV